MHALAFVRCLVVLKYLHRTQQFAARSRPRQQFSDGGKTFLHSFVQHTVCVLAQVNLHDGGFSARGALLVCLKRRYDVNAFPTCELNDSRFNVCLTFLSPVADERRGPRAVCLTSIIRQRQLHTCLDACQPCNAPAVLIVYLPTTNQVIVNTRN